MPLLIPDEFRKANLRAIHQHLSDFKNNGHSSSLANAVSRMMTDPDFAREIRTNPNLSTLPSNNAGGLKFAWAFLYMLLYRRDYVAAALILWGPSTFTPEPHCAQMMWNALFERSLINVMGCASVGKTFAPSAWMLLDWVLDPEWTRVQISSNSEDHVKKNLFADMVRLHSESVLELPGIVDSESISLNKKRAMGIFILTIPGGPTSRGKLKGAKIKNRPPHPLFGDNSRLRVILDEAQEISANIFDEVPNLLASMDNSTEHIKIIAAANPKDEWSRYGQNCKPIGGWEKLPEDAEQWESDTGWWVISINAMRTENVMARRTIFPRMITYEGVRKIIRSQGGGNDQHPICFTFIYGRFPKTGLLSTVIKTEHLRRAEGEWEFDGPTVSIASCDPAFTGDLPTMASGRVGRAVAWRSYSGERTELPEPRMAIQVDAMGILNRGDTQDLADEIFSRCKQLNVRAGGFGIDKMQPVTEPVLTPSGWIPIGKLGVGDQVIGSNGMGTTVTGVFPQIDRRVMKVMFSDGSWTRCGPEHLWTVKHVRRKTSETLTTELLAQLIRLDRQKRWTIPILSASVEFARGGALPIDPYLFGCLLGDGNLRKDAIRFSSIDAELLNEVSRRLPIGHVFKHTDRCNYIVVSESKKTRSDKGMFAGGSNSLLSALRLLGLAGKLSHEKFIPKCYLMAPPSARLELLQGLMDTDGFVNRVKGRTSACASIRLSSLVLIEQIIELVESLGGTARYRTHPTSCNGKPGRQAHVATIMLPPHLSRFKLSRKRDSVSNRCQPIARFISSIEPDGEEDSVCIRVEAEDHLYTTRHHILTHNTGVGLGVHDIVRRQWDQKVGKADVLNGDQANICGINYAQSPTEIKICAEDTETPRESYDRIATELYFAAAKLLEFDCVRLGRGVDAKTFEELASRRGGMQVGLGKKQTLESKDAYKSRTGENSPDRADCLTILLHVARTNTPNLLPKAPDTADEKPERGTPAWEGFNQSFGACEMSGMAGSGEMVDLLTD